MKKIIAPVDFSAAAANAAIFAGSLAAFYGAELWLYHCFDTAIPVSAFGYPFVTPSEMKEASEHEMEKFAAGVQSALRRQIVIHTLVENGVLTDGLAQLAAAEQADVVVMGLSGKNALTRLVVGSNTIRAIRQLTCPVLVVPPGAEFLPVRKIGFACDYDKVAETTPVGPLKKLLHDFNAELMVLNVVQDEGPAAEEKIKEGMYIHKILEEFKPAYQTVMTEDITAGINWFAEKEKIDWLVVVPKKHNLVERLFSRSQTQSLLHHTTLPVLCLHE